MNSSMSPGIADGSNLGSLSHRLQGSAPCAKGLYTARDAFIFKEGGTGLASTPDTELRPIFETENQTGGGISNARFDTSLTAADLVEGNRFQSAAI